MKLFLAAEAKNPVNLKNLRKFVGGFEHKKIAYIPTAANGEQVYGAWRKGGSWKKVQTLGAKVTLVELETQRYPEILKVLKGIDIIWFAGGMPGYLMYWLRRLQLDKELTNILKSDAVYVGSSAGSMIASPTLKVSEWYIGEQEIGASVIPGLHLVDFDIYPHYEDSLYAEIQSHYKGKKLYLLKNEEAIIVENGNVSVLGQERRIENR